MFSCYKVVGYRKMDEKSHGKVTTWWEYWCHRSGVVKRDGNELAYIHRQQPELMDCQKIVVSYSSL